MHSEVQRTMIMNSSGNSAYRPMICHSNLNLFIFLFFFPFSSSLYFFPVFFLSPPHFFSSQLSFHYFLQISPFLYAAIFHAPSPWRKRRIGHCCQQVGTWSVSLVTRSTMSEPLTGCRASRIGRDSEYLSLFLLSTMLFVKVFFVCVCRYFLIFRGQRERSVRSLLVILWFSLSQVAIERAAVSMVVLLGPLTLIFASQLKHPLPL